MNAIVKIESDLVSEFNSYMQQKEHAMAFVSENEGYFSIRSNDFGASSAAIVEFGNFLTSSGYSINSIQSATTKEGEEGTVMSFTKEGKEGSAVLSTIRIY